MARKVFGNARQLPSGRWQIRYRKNGKEYNCTPGVTYADKDEALTALAAFEAEYRKAGKQAPASKPVVPLLKDFAWQWWEVRTADPKRISPNTRAGYRSMITSCILRGNSPLLDLTVDQVGPMQVEAWLNALSQPYLTGARDEDDKPIVREGVGASTRVKAFRVLSMILKAAKGQRFIPDNPCEGIEPVRRGQVEDERRQHYYFYLAETARLIRAAYATEQGSEDWTGGWGEYWELLAWSGMRPGEVRALTAEQLQPLTCTIDVRAGISEGDSTTKGRLRTITKKGGQRTPVIPKAVMDRLVARVERLGLKPTDLLWINEKGESRWSSTHRDSWYRVINEAEILGHPTERLEGRRAHPIPYDLRAAQVSYLRAVDVPLVEVQAQVGHESREVTDFYTVVQQAGAEDPLVVEARTDVAAGRLPLTRKAVIEWLYARCQEVYVPGSEASAPVESEVA